MAEAGVLVFGATSMVGSSFVSSGPSGLILAGRTAPSTSAGAGHSFRRVDLSETETVRELVRSSPGGAVVNFAARTDVDGVERERPGPGDDPEKGPAFAVNAIAPAAMAEAARTSGKYFIQLSTDFVFDGRSGPHEEEELRPSLTPALSWYGWTKSEGERRVLQADGSAAVVRLANPYRSRFPAKLDFARWIVDRRRAGSLPPMYTDQQITPSWIPDVTRVLGWMLERRPSGVFHVASPLSTTPWEFATELVRTIEGKEPRLEPTLLGSANPPPGRAPRPIRGGLRSRRLEQAGIPTTAWREGIRRLAGEEGWT